MLISKGQIQEDFFFSQEDFVFYMKTLNKKATARDKISHLLPALKLDRTEE